MEARVKQDARWKSITAFSGLEFVKMEWRPVPAGCEAEAKRNPFLEVREKPVEVAEEPAKAPGEKAAKVAE